MPTTVLSRQRSWVAILAVLAMVASIMVIARPAQAALADTSATCPASIPSAGFTDLAGLDAATVSAIDCLVFYGVTKGTSATTYSPNASVARWQMALFLTRSLTTMGVALPSGADQGFTDIGALDADTQKAINQLAQLGITKGTTATTFSPTDDVSRWQMALFLTRTLSAAGTVLPSGASQGFTDIGTLDAATQTAINQTVQLGVSNGTSATTFTPLADTLRWHMALFLTRSLAVDGVVPVGLGNFVTAFVVGTSYTYADATACATVKVTPASTDTYRVNGVVATKNAFYAALGGAANVTVQNLGTVHAVETGVKVNSGVIATATIAGVGGNFTIEEPVAGATLNTVTYGNAFDFYSVDGAAATEAGFERDVSPGDSVAITGGDGTTSAKTRTIALTNGSLSGTATGAGDPVGIETSCQVFSVLSTWPAGDTFSYTVDGVADTQANFVADLSAGDTVTYMRSGLKTTWTLTNGAVPAITGRAVALIAASQVWAGYGSGNTLKAYYAQSGVGAADSDGSATVKDMTGGAAVGTYRVNGAVGNQADFEAKLTLGDTIVYQQDNAATAADESALWLTDGAFSGKPKTHAGTTITITLNSVETLAVDYTSTNSALTGLATVGTGTVKYQVNGGSISAANLATFQAAVNLAIAANAGNVSVAQSGNDVVWSVTTS